MHWHVHVTISRSLAAKRCTLSGTIRPSEPECQVQQPHVLEGLAVTFTRTRFVLSFGCRLSCTTARCSCDMGHRAKPEALQLRAVRSDIQVHLMCLNSKLVIKNSGHAVA
jgi:hypothetical protein